MRCKRGWGPVERARGDNHVDGFNRGRLALHQKALGPRLLLDRDDPDAAAQRSVDQPGVALQEPNDVLSRGKALRVIPLVGILGQLKTPVGELKHQGIPALAPPSLTDPSAFEDDVFSPQLA